MPSPVGHALGGLIVALVGMPTDRDREGNGDPDSKSGRDHTVRSRMQSRFPPVRKLVVCVAAAVLPDADFLWGRHNMETHSLGAAVLAGLAVLAWTRGRDLRLAGLVTLACASHVLFDWLGSDTTPPIGVMALWPVTGNYYFAYAYMFEAISRRTHLPNFWSHNVRAVAWEVVMLAPVTALAGWARGWRWRCPVASESGSREGCGRD